MKLSTFPLGILCSFRAAKSKYYVGRMGTKGKGATPSPRAKRVPSTIEISTISVVLKSACNNRSKVIIPFASESGVNEAQVCYSLACLLCISR